MENKNYAVIDMGTNTFHLLVVKVDEDGIQLLCKEKMAVKIGQGGISKGVLAEDAIDRAVVALQYFYTKAMEYSPIEIFATATSAVRSAANKDVLIEKVKATTGLIIQVISGELEAELIYEGVRQSMDLGSENSLIMDIGGGSVEFILCNKDKIHWKGSFEIGGQRLIDLFHQHEPILETDIQALKDFLEERLRPLLEACLLHPPTILVGASGSFDTLASIDILQKNLNINIENEKEYELSKGVFYTIFKLVKPLTRSQRLEIPGMLELRAEMIVVACVLIDYVLGKIDFNTIRVSTYALKEGVLARLIAGNSIE